MQEKHDNQPVLPVNTDNNYLTSPKNGPFHHTFAVNDLVEFSGFLQERQYNGTTGTIVQIFQERTCIQITSRSGIEIRSIRFANLTKSTSYSAQADRPCYICGDTPNFKACTKCSDDIPQAQTSEGREEPFDQKGTHCGEQSTLTTRSAKSGWKAVMVPKTPQ